MLNPHNSYMQNDLFKHHPTTASQSVKTMSSLQIAEITGKNHADVMRDIRSTLDQAEIGLSKFASSYRNSQNKDQPCYHLPRRECDLVVSGYSVKYRLAIIDRWHELENKQSFQLPGTFAEALKLAAAQAEELEAKTAALTVAAPKVDFYDAVTASDTVVNVATAAQLAKLPYGQNTLFKRLRERGILISGTARHNCPKQQYIEQGLFTVVEYARENSGGQTVVSFTAMVTQKGLAWIVKNLGGR